MSQLFMSLALGRLKLKHRVVTAPLTRMRAGEPGDVPTSLHVEHYGQRASDAGLIIAEATQISSEAKGYPVTPGIHTHDQVVGWRSVTKAVHAKGGLIVLQVWHVGRVSHSSHQVGGTLPVAPSAIAAEGETFGADWATVAFEVPRSLENHELPRIVADYRSATERAMAAGFDGVEIHAANGYLLEQFLQDGSNKRRDAYGGSVENRVRLLLEVVDAVARIFGHDAIGVRMSPHGRSKGVTDSAPTLLFRYALAALSTRKLAYVHLIEPRYGNAGLTDAVK